MIRTDRWLSLRFEALPTFNLIHGRIILAYLLKNSYTVWFNKLITFLDALLSEFLPRIDKSGNNSLSKISILKTFSLANMLVIDVNFQTKIQY